MSINNSKEEIKRYEKEFSKFLIEKINHAGGSLQFQYLLGNLHLLRFEVRNAVGSNRHQLMDFLKTHKQIFKIDSKGVVSVINSILSEGSDNSDDNTEQDSVPIKKNLQVKIDNGEGTVITIKPNFAIIAALTPIETNVYFTPSEYGAHEDSLFGIDVDLETGTEVYFNANHGHSDYGIEYRATKVWRKPDSDDDLPDPQNHKKSKNVENLLNADGVVKEIRKDSGIISVFDREDETVLFYKNNVENCTNLKVGDHVEFTAKPGSGRSKVKWEALSVIKKTKQSCNQSSSDFAKKTSSKNVNASDTKKNRIENQTGKIYPYDNGAVIRFGKDFSEKADGQSSDYYYLGSKIKVSDIIWEFSEGDDVLFDAVKTKKLPGWKAYLVWTGEKPTYRNIPEVDDDSDEITEEQSSSSVVSSDSSNSLMRSKTKDKKHHNTENKENKKSSSTVFAHSNSRKNDKFQDECRKENYSKAKSNDQNNYVNAQKFKKQKYKSGERSAIKFNKFARRGRNGVFTEQSSYAAKCDKSTPESVPNIHIGSNEDTSEDDEFYNAATNPRKFLIEEKYNDSISSSEENCYDNKSNEVRQINELKSKKACIKKYKDLVGEVISVLCKVAKIKCSDLQKKEVEFVLSVFYVNGESIEERQIMDLREVVKVGDRIYFNCFEIIDDSGDLYNMVTSVWKDHKPHAVEVTPAEFIQQNDLSVSLDTNMDGCRPESSNEVNHQIEFKSKEKSYKTADSDSETESAINVTLDDMVNKSFNEPEGEISENLNDSDHSSGTEDEEEQSLSNQIIQRLRMAGFISEDSQVDLKIVPEIIDLVLTKYRIVDSSSRTVNQDGIRSEMLCPSCLTKDITCSYKDTTVKHAAVQTIITGEIVATSIFTQN